MRRCQSANSGQAMVEACIGLALMVFVLLLSGYTTYMGSNKIRTAMAARHAAWLKGSGGDPTVRKVNGWFFFNDDITLVGVGIEAGRGSIASLISGETYGYENRRDAHWVEVTFGVGSSELASTDKYPFLVVNSRLPFMPAMNMDHFSRVASHCQWESVAETWRDSDDALSGVLNLISSEVQAALDGLGDLASRILDMMF